MLRRARVARLATADTGGRPHVVPVCFVYAGRVIEIAIDEKPKRVSPERLRRVRNVRANPHVALVVDEYHEDWRRLRYVLVLGRAAVLGPGSRRHASTVARLRRKYPQYRMMRLEDRPVIRIMPRRLILWESLPSADYGRARAQTPMIRKLKSGEYRLYSRKLDPKTGRRRNLGTFKTRAAAEKHERAVQFFKHH